MAMRTYFHRLSKSQLDFILENCNISEDESILLNMASSRCSDIQIAEKLNVSTSCVTKRKSKMMSKILDFLEDDNMVTVYINGKPVTKEEMKEYGIQIDSVKKTIVGKLTKKDK
jgi:hypothetical protein